MHPQLNRNNIRNYVRRIFRKHKRYYDGFDGSLSLLSNNSLEKTLSLTILFVVSESNHSTKHAYKHTHTTPSIQFSEIMATGLQTRLSSADVDFDAFDAET